MNIYHGDTETRRTARLLPLIPQIGADRFSSLLLRSALRLFSLFLVWPLLLVLLFYPNDFLRVNSVPLCLRGDIWFLIAALLLLCVSVVGFK
jgi:hypothetical protein